MLLKFLLFLMFLKFFLVFVIFFPSSLGTKNGPLDPFRISRFTRNSKIGSAGPFLVPLEVVKRKDPLTLGQILLTPKRENFDIKVLQ